MKRAKKEEKSKNKFSFTIIVMRNCMWFSRDWSHQSRIILLLFSSHFQGEEKKRVYS
jgi:hypothetical protein